MPILISGEVALMYEGGEMAEARMITVDEPEIVKSLQGVHLGMLFQAQGKWIELDGPMSDDQVRSCLALEHDFLNAISFLDLLVNNDFSLALRQEGLSELEKLLANTFLDARLLHLWRRSKEQLPPDLAEIIISAEEGGFAQAAEFLRVIADVPRV